MSDNPTLVDRSATDLSSNTPIEDLIRDRQLIVVSNRQPYRHEAGANGDLTVDRPAGGLTAGLDPAMQRTGGTWVAWGDGDKDFDVTDNEDCVSVPPDDPSYQLKRVRLSDEQIRDYYYGFSNQVLWPVCHSALTEIRCDPSFWRRYCGVNERFADAVVDRTGARPIVWFQDYHLALAPNLVRRRLPDDAIVMHFWHIPWPAWDTFRACPHRRELLKGLLGNDLLGFHTPRYRTNFLQCVDAALDGAGVDWRSGNVTHRGETTAVAAIPMGVPFDEIERSIKTRAAGSFWPTFAREHDFSNGTRIAVGVDRLDYTKGVVERLRALERLWETRPQWRGEVTYVQNGSESRSEIPAYREIQLRVTEEIDRINNRFGTDGWQPIVSVTDHLSRAELYEVYRHADLALVSPLRDGMNLVAQEYVAAQENGNGVLVLSDQAGIHDEIGEHAVTVTPWNTEQFAEAIAGALSMPPSERGQRMHHLREWVAANDLDSWLESNFLATKGTDSTSHSTNYRSIPTT